MSIAEITPPVETLEPMALPASQRQTVKEKPLIAWKQAIPVLIVLAPFLPLLVMHGVNLWAKPHYQFFPLVLIGAAVLSWFNVKRQGRLQPGRFQRAALIVGILSLVGLAASAFLMSSLIAMGSFLIGLLAFIYSWGGWRLTMKLLPAWIFLWLAVPPPFNWDQDFITWLKFVTAGWTGYVLDVFGILHVMKGNVVIIPPYQPLGVEEACSGIHSFFAIITCALFFIFWLKRPILHAIFLIAGSVGFVLTANVARVVLIAVAQVRFNIDLAHGLRHDVLGFVIFFFLLGLVISLDQLLCFIFHSTYSFMALFRKGRMVLNKMLEAQKKKIDLGATRWPPLSATWAYAKPVLGLALLLCVANYGLAAIGLIEVTRPSDAPMVAALGTLSEDSLGLRIESITANMAWDKIDFQVPEERARDDKLGQYSRTWRYKHPSLDEPSTYSVDYTFYNWHDLTVCYRMNGWKLDGEQKLVKRALPNGETDVYTEALFRMEDGKIGYLIFSLIDDQGKIQEARSGESMIKERLRRLQDAVQRRPTELRFQVQVFATSYNIIGTAEQERLRDLFFKCRDRTIKQYLAARHGGN